jgi:arylsulfatase A-like enzyme
LGHDQSAGKSSHTHTQSRAVRKGQYKLIEYVTDSERHTQLFNLDIDPHEKKNLAERPVHAEHLRHMRDQLMALRQQYADHRDLEMSFWDGFGEQPRACDGVPAAHDQ